MEENKIENKVILSLEDFLELRDKAKNIENKNTEILEVLWNSFELTYSDKNKMRLQVYQNEETKIARLLKEMNEERYNKILENLKQKEEE